MLHQTSCFYLKWAGAVGIGLAALRFPAGYFPYCASPAGGPSAMGWRLLSFSRGHSSAGEHRLCTAATWVRFPLAPPFSLRHENGLRRDGRAADCGGLENRRRFTPSGGSNPPPSAICCFIETANLAGSPGAASQYPFPSLRMAGGVSCHAAGRFHRGGGLSFFPSAPAPRGDPGENRCSRGSVQRGGVSFPSLTHQHSGNTPGGLPSRRASFFQGAQL